MNISVPRHKLKVPYLEHRYPRAWKGSSTPYSWDTQYIIPRLSTVPHESMLIVGRKLLLLEVPEQLLVGRVLCEVCEANGPLGFSRLEQGVHRRARGRLVTERPRRDQRELKLGAGIDMLSTMQSGARLPLRKRGVRQSPVVA
jgi:hypothetical protein